MNVSFVFRMFAVLTVALFGLFAVAQDEDFSIPGEEPAAAAAADPVTPAAGVVEKDRGSLLGLVMKGGWAMIPLFIMLFALVGLAVYLILDLKRGTFAPRELGNNLKESAEKGDLPAILQASQDNSSCLGRVMTGATQYIYDRGYEVLDRDSIYDLMADASLEFNRRRVGLINYFSVISQAAPMVGLLGTVSGMIKAFQTLGGSGMGDPGQLAGNISEALITTAAGLVVAVPAIFGYFFFRDKLSNLIASVDKEASVVLNSLRRAVYKKPNS